MSDSRADRTGRDAVALVPGEAGLTREVVDRLRDYIVEADRLSQAFCDAHGIHRTDLHALMHLRDAARRGEEVTAGRLADHLGLSSGATTSVIDRLERDGHVQRVRGDSDRRRVTVRFDRAVDGVGRTFFRPLGERSDAVLADFTEEELQVVLRFLGGMTGAVAAEIARITADAEEQRPTG